MDKNNLEDQTENNKLNDLISDLISDLKYRQLAWACRRGMLELDIILMRYLENFYPKATQEEKETFEYLLTQQDQDLFNWLIKKQACPDIKLLALVDFFNQGFS